METKADVARNPEAFMQIGDFVASTFFLSALTLFVIALFILLQFRSAPERWRLPLLLASFVPLVAAIGNFARGSFWIKTLTNPVEFKFFDWFITVPVMAIIFYYFLKPLGAKRWMVVRLGLAALWMLVFGYIGEAAYPEDSVLWGILGSIGFAAIIGMLMGEGYPRIFKEGVDPELRRGYLFLSILLPLSWSIYPIGYMTTPGNVLEGALSVDTVAIMYNLADMLSKGGLALGTIYIASKTKAPKQVIYTANSNGNGKGDHEEAFEIITEPTRILKSSSSN
ncbi:MAG: bacteriorhodopsin [Bacteroidota bacterium]